MRLIGFCVLCLLSGNALASSVGALHLAGIVRAMLAAKVSLSENGLFLENESPNGLFVQIGDGETLFLERRKEFHVPRAELEKSPEITILAP